MIECKYLPVTEQGSLLLTRSLTGSLFKKLHRSLSAYLWLWHSGSNGCSHISLCKFVAYRTLFLALAMYHA
jgi:hypothetical protein